MLWFFILMLAAALAVMLAIAVLAPRPETAYAVGALSGEPVAAGAGGRKPASRVVHARSAPPDGIALDRAMRWCTAIYAKIGFAPRDASVLARSAVHAEARGRCGHGLLQVVEITAAVRRGEISPAAHPSISRTGNTACLAATSVAGPIALRTALITGAEMADRWGVACVSCAGSGWFGSLDVFVEETVREGYLVSARASINRRLMCGFSAGEAILGTNPTCLGIPGNPPVVTDCSSSVIPYHMLSQDREREPIGMDRWGMRTGESRDVLEGGALLPRSSDEHLFAATALFGDCLAMLCGMPVDGDGRDRQSVHLVVRAVPREAGRRIDALVARVRAARPEPGCAVRLPGDRARERFQEARERGLRVSPDVLAKLQATASELGVAPLV